MNCGKVEEPSSSRRRYPSTAKYAATFAILTAISLKSDRAPTSPTVSARPGWIADLNLAELRLAPSQLGRAVQYRLPWIVDETKQFIKEAWVQLRLRTTLSGCDHVPLGQSLNFRLSHRREVCVFGSNDPSRNVRVVAFQIFFQEVGGVAFSSGVTDDHDLIRRSEIFRDLLIKRILFGYALATVVRFLSMNQMMMEMERIVRLYLVLVRRATSTEILVDMGGVVVDDDNHTAGPGPFFCGRASSGIF